MARDRSFTISLEDYETELAFRDAVRQALLDTEAIGHREGGAFVNTPIRVELEPRPTDFVSGGEPIRRFATVGWMFSHTFMPAARSTAPPPGVDLHGPRFYGDAEALGEDEIDARGNDQNLELAEEPLTVMARTEPE